jgi:hypothetical protein
MQGITSTDPHLIDAAAAARRFDQLLQEHKGNAEQAHMALQSESHGMVPFAQLAMEYKRFKESQPIKPVDENSIRSQLNKAVSGEINQGVGALPVHNIGSESAYAEGGIVAFAGPDGSQVKSDTAWTPDMDTELAQYEKLAKLANPLPQPFGDVPGGMLTPRVPQNVRDAWASASPRYNQLLALREKAAAAKAAAAQQASANSILTQYNLPQIKPTPTTATPPAGPTGPAQPPQPPPVDYTKYFGSGDLADLQGGGRNGGSPNIDDFDLANNKAWKEIVSRFPATPVEDTKDIFLRLQGANPKLQKMAYDWIDKQDKKSGTLEQMEKFSKRMNLAQLGFDIMSKGTRAAGGVFGGLGLSGGDYAQRAAAIQNNIFNAQENIDKSKMDGIRALLSEDKADLRTAEIEHGSQVRERNAAMKDLTTLGVGLARDYMTHKDSTAYLRAVMGKDAQINRVQGAMIRAYAAHDKEGYEGLAGLLGNLQGLTPQVLSAQIGAGTKRLTEVDKSPAYIQAERIYDSKTATGPEKQAAWAIMQREQNRILGAGSPGTPVSFDQLTQGPTR